MNAHSIVVVVNELGEESEGVRSIFLNYLSSLG